MRKSNSLEEQMRKFQAEQATSMFSEYSKDEEKPKEEYETGVENESVDAEDKHNSTYILKIALGFLILVIVSVYLIIKTSNSYASEKSNEDFLAEDEQEQHGLRIVSLCQGNAAKMTDDFKMKLVCIDIDESAVFEVLYQNGNTESPIPMPGSNSDEFFNPVAVTGKQLKEGCIFLLKNRQSATIVGLPNLTRYLLTDLTDDEDYTRETIGGNDIVVYEGGFYATGNVVSKETGESVTKSDSEEVKGVYLTKSGTEKIGFTHTKGIQMPAGLIGIPMAYCIITAIFFGSSIILEVRKALKKRRKTTSLANGLANSN